MIKKIGRDRGSFMESIGTKNEVTIEGYRYALDNFESFWNEKYPETDLVFELNQMEEQTIYDTLQAWLNYNKKLNPSTSKTYFGKLKRFFYHIGVKLDQQDIDNELSFKQIETEEKYGLSLEEIQEIFTVLRSKHSTFFTCQISSLMRVGEMVQLKKNMLTIDEKNIIVHIPKHIAKKGKARTTYFSKEATKLILPKLKTLGENDLVFGTSDNKFTSKTNIQHIIKYALEKVGLDMKKDEAGKFNKITTHSFRAYGITKLNRVGDRGMIGKISGQKLVLDEYDRVSEKERYEFYKKNEIELLINDTEIRRAKARKDKAEIQSLKNDKAELVKVNEEKYSLQKKEMKAYFDKLMDKEEIHKLKTGRDMTREEADKIQ